MTFDPHLTPLDTFRGPKRGPRGDFLKIWPENLTYISKRYVVWKFGENRIKNEIYLIIWRFCYYGFFTIWLFNYLVFLPYSFLNIWHFCFMVFCQMAFCPFVEKQDTRYAFLKKFILCNVSMHCKDLRRYYISPTT